MASNPATCSRVFVKPTQRGCIALNLYETAPSADKSGFRFRSYVSVVGDFTLATAYALSTLGQLECKQRSKGVYSPRINPDPLLVIGRRRAHV